MNASLLEEVFTEVDTEESSNTETANVTKPLGFLEDVFMLDTDSVLHKSKREKDKHILQEANCSTILKKIESTIHEGFTDSSDDEDNKYFEERKYNDCGKNLKNLIKQKNAPKDFVTKEPSKEKTWTSQQSVKEALKVQLDKLNGNSSVRSNVSTPKGDLLVDPIFGMRVINPCVSSSSLKVKMAGRTSVGTLKIKRFVESTTAKEADWVTGGAVVSKIIKTSQKGNQYCLWNVSDLHGDIKIISVLLFGSAYKEYWKTPVGAVVGILNPHILDNKDRIEATLRVDNADRILVMGTAKDFGICKSKRKNGENCSSVVNTSKCDFCIYHMKKEYSKACRRSDLQPPKIGRSLDNLRAKVLGKSEVFYGGKIFKAVPGKKSSNLMKKDEERLKALSGGLAVLQKLPCSLSVTQKIPGSLNVLQKKRDTDILNRLGKDVNTLKKLEQGTNFMNRLEKAKSVDTFQSNIKSGKVSGCLSILEKKRDLDSLNKLRKEVDAMTTSTNEKLEGERTSESSSVSPKMKDADILNRLRKGGDITNKPDTDKIEGTLKSKGPTISGNFSQNITESLNGLDKLNGLEKSKAINASKGAVRSPKTPERVINLDFTISKKDRSAAKANALKYIRQHGPIKKVEEGKTKKTPEQVLSLKRKVEMENETKEKRAKTDNDQTETKKGSDKLRKNGITEKFLELMNSQTKNNDLLKIAETEEREKYFNKLEIREKIEDKMASTFKVECKAVRCLKCNYKSFSASDLCKKEKHPLKVVNAVKRFWKCGNCSARTVCLELVPLHSCTTCGGAKWERASMMREKKDPGLNVEPLSLRGHEEKYIGATVKNANLNLLVPE